MFELEYKINGNINLICDICASEYSQKIENYFTQIVKFSNKSIVSSDDDIIFIDANKTSLDISHYLYELISVSIPAKRIHKNKKDCDQNVLNKLTSFETTKKGAVQDTTSKIYPSQIHMINRSLPRHQHFHRLSLVHMTSARPCACCCLFAP